MKVLVQRVLSASVKVEGEVISKIDSGFLLYVCFETEDTMTEVDKAIAKIINLRIFEDENQKMNQNISQVNGEILSVSQFTLSWDGRKGHRPSFDQSMEPNKAKILFRTFNDKLKENSIDVSVGRFGADMKVESINDGPVTFFFKF